MTVAQLIIFLQALPDPTVEIHLETDVDAPQGDDDPPQFSRLNSLRQGQIAEFNHVPEPAIILSGAVLGHAV